MAKKMNKNVESQNYIKGIGTQYYRNMINFWQSIFIFPEYSTVFK